MIGTDEGRGVAGIGPAQPIAPMPADVEKGVDVALAVPHHQDGVLAHRRAEEVPRLGDLTLMAQKQPAAGKDLCQLLLVDRWLNKDTSTDQAALDIHQTPWVRHHATPPDAVVGCRAERAVHSGSRHPERRILPCVRQGDYGRWRCPSQPSAGRAETTCALHGGSVLEVARTIFAQCITRCSASNLAEVWRLSGPFAIQSPEKTRVSAMPPRSQIDQLRPSTHSEKLSDPDTDASSTYRPQLRLFRFPSRIM